MADIPPIGDMVTMQREGEADPKQGVSSDFERGLAMRRKVIGDDYVDNALKSAEKEYWQPAQQLITEVPWGRVWTRPGLELKQRSLINIAFLTALKLWPELAAHTKGAIRNGVTELEIREALIQSMIYCGFPTGIEAMKVTEKAIEEMIESGEHKRQLKEKVQKQEV